MRLTQNRSTLELHQISMAIIQVRLKLMVEISFVPASYKSSLASQRYGDSALEGTREQLAIKSLLLFFF